MLNIKKIPDTAMGALSGKLSDYKQGESLPWDEFHWYHGDIRPQIVHQEKNCGWKRPKMTKFSHRLRDDERDVMIAAKKGQGKVTDCGNDRFPCIYTRIPIRYDFLFEAEVTVVSFLHEPGPNQRESFGIFARDTMKPDPFTGEYYSNMAAVGGYYGRFNFFGRDGVRANDQDNIRNFYLYPRVGDHGTFYEEEPLHYRVSTNRPVRMRLLLQKKGSVITGRMTSLDGSDLLSPSYNGGEGEIAGDGHVIRGEDGYSVCLPDAFSKRDRTWIYIGFHVADGSSMKVHRDTVRITLTETAGEDSRLEISSRSCNSVEKDVHDRSLLCDQSDLPASVRDNYETGKTWIASVNGTLDGTGTELSPMDLQTAINHCRPGDTVLVKDGSYLLSGSVCMGKGDAGECECRKILKGESTKTILDFQNSSGALIIHGDYWVIDGISVTKGHGIKVEGSFNVIRNCRSFRNLETGILIRYPDLSSSKDRWPSGNLVEDSVAFENRDLSECNADGFACKVAAGKGNCFRNCISWLNSDDGFDLFTKNRNIGGVSLIGCRSYLNGYRAGVNGELVATAGNGNGFKLGGSGLAIKHELKGCIAAGNRKYGFTSNSNPYMSLEGCNAFRNGHENCMFYYYAARKVLPKKIIRDCSFEDKNVFDAKELLKQLYDQYACDQYAR